MFKKWDDVCQKIVIEHDSDKLLLKTRYLCRTGRQIKPPLALNGYLK